MRISNEQRPRALPIRGALRQQHEPLAGDVGLTLAVLGVSAALLLDGDLAPGFRSPTLLTWVLALVVAASAGTARRRPLAALLVTGASAVLLTWHGDETDVVPFVVTGLLFVVGSRCARCSPAR